ncbi:MAG: hypothetical protein ACLRYE_11685 [Gemmiger formicilis]|uniref:hypothetical protein n=1 Tax=Gemmiger formicilis TaxID=745368 RepID=UPI0039A1A362
MPIKVVEGSMNVLDAAITRVRNVFKNDCKIYLSFSSGKDSLCMASIVYDLIRAGEIDGTKLTVTFIDEEGLYPSMVEAAHRWRRNFLSRWRKIPVVLSAVQAGVGHRPSFKLGIMDNMGAWQGRCLDAQAARLCHHVQSLPALPRRNELSDILRKSVC